MTTAPDKNYFRCPDGHRHELEYRRLGEEGDQYTCNRCDFECDKYELKKHTDRLKAK